MPNSELMVTSNTSERKLPESAYSEGALDALADRVKDYMESKKPIEAEVAELQAKLQAKQAELDAYNKAIDSIAADIQHIETVLGENKQDVLSATTPMDQMETPGETKYFVDNNGLVVSKTNPYSLNSEAV